MKYKGIDSCAALEEVIAEVGFLPLLATAGGGFSAEEIVSRECGYTALPGGGWEWPLWEWKGGILRDTGCAYGKFFNGKAGFVSREWWPHFRNWRRGVWPKPDDNSVEAAIISTLHDCGPLITRELRAECGFTGPKMRGRFDAYVTRLMMGGHVVTDDFVYPTDRHGRRYGWGWARLTTPEARFGNSLPAPGVPPRQSRSMMLGHLSGILPEVKPGFFDRILGQ